METINYTENSIRTFTGKSFDLKIMHPDSICIEDIAHALSNTARFGGHLPKLYTVAQHSVMVSDLVIPSLALTGFLHDATEAYIGDMPSPFKKMMPEFKEIENKLMQVIALKYNLMYPFDEMIKEADRYALRLEMEAFMYDTRAMKCWYPEEAKERFLNKFNELNK